VREVLPLGDLAVALDAARERDVVGIVGAQDAMRIPWLVPIRYGRMLRSVFVFYRGTAGLMAHDLAASPNSGLQVQLCGDAHLLNFGVFGTPERKLAFDLNDFDETLTGPFEWDVKRLVASMVLAARSIGAKPKRQRAIAQAAAWRYRDAIRALAERDALANWYEAVDVDNLLATIEQKAARAFAADIAERARTRDHLKSAARLTEVVGGRLRITPNPPLIVPLDEFPDPMIAADPEAFVRYAFLEYLETVGDAIRVLLDRYTFVDAALKVVGVGSVGTRCAIVLFQGPKAEDLLILQAKQATASELEAYLPPSPYGHHGRRVVEGQRLMQAASDLFLGWATGPGGADYYWRQLRDWKGSVDVTKMDETILELYGRLCAVTLANAHARSGDPIAIAAYLGSSTRFDEALATFAVDYADQTERDYAALAEAAGDGRIEAQDDSPLARR
jgi:uncharacterized protein (DUF2252 family)